MVRSLLVVGVGEPLAANLAKLFSGFDVTVVDDLPADPSTARALAQGADVIVCGLPSAGDDLGHDALFRATASIYHLLMGADRAEHFILLSSLRTFERYPVDFIVTEYWAPRPTSDIADLIVMSAETVVREMAHVLPLRVTCLRTGTIVDHGGPHHSRAVHVEDVVAAIGKTLEHSPVGDEPDTGWRVFHIVGAGNTRFSLGMAAIASEYPNGGRGSALGYEPVHDVSGDEAIEPLPQPSRKRFSSIRGGRAKRVLILGAGGPFGELAVKALRGDHILRVTDIQRLPDEVIRGSDPTQFTGPIGEGHEIRNVDVTEYAEVLAAMEGMDAVVNLTVVREDPAASFRVNTLGAYNIARAALESGIRRVVMTGPNQVFNPMNGAYWPDFHLGSDVPQRPGSHIYMLSKFVGQEISRVFAEEHDMEFPMLVFGYFANPGDGPHPLGGHPFMVSWADTAEAIRCALRLPGFPRPHEVFHIQGDMPHGKYRNDRAKEVLGWQPRDDLETLWRRPS